MYNYILTRARRMVVRAFGMLCNKRRIFHRANDVHPDFCYVLVKTCCLLHKFFRETAFSFRILYSKIPSRLLRLLALEVMLLERIWGGTLKGQASLRGGPVGEPGRELVYRGLTCERRLWRRAPLSIRARAP
jgi:hypothetical protein